MASDKPEPDFGYGGSLSTEGRSEEPGPDEEILLWNSFKVEEPEPTSGSMAEKRWYEVMLIIIKAFLYVFLFLAILGGSVVVKGSLLFATSQINGKFVPFCEYFPGRSTRELPRYESALPVEARMSWAWCVILAFAAPEVLEFLRFLWNCFFVDFKLVKFHHYLFITVVESLHAAGLALLAFVVLPDVDVVQGAALCSCVCFVPSILGLFSRFNMKKAEHSRFDVYIDAGAILFQSAGIVTFTVIYYDYNKMNSFTSWLFPIALVLSSLRWWSNYVSRDSKFEFIRNIAWIRASLQTIRPLLLGYTSVLRILVFFLSSMLILYYRGVSPETFMGGLQMREFNVTIRLLNRIWQEGAEVVVPAEATNYTFIPAGGQDRWIPLYVFIINAVTGVFVYGCCKFACKTLMQGFGFALPLSLSLPVTAAGLYLMVRLREDECFYHNGLGFDLPDYIFFNVPEYKQPWYYFLWPVWMFSQYWIMLHIWYTTNERLATTDKIFAVSSYDAILIDQSLALSRWREEPDDVDYFDEKIGHVEDTMKVKAKLGNIRKEDHVTRIYACATMWHETPEEMTDFLNSILRLDRDQCIMRILQNQYSITSPDYYELEVHIFFDDALKCVHGCNVRCLHNENKTQVNEYVVDFVKAVEECVRKRNLRPSPPVKYPTPYGGRLVWTLPEQTKMYVHLKDKNKIRTRKRWSQVMYMYYLLGYRLMELPIDIERKEVIAENTYILTLDGDIDFRPSAVRVLVDRMRVNKDLGSACGRIHPLGEGPLVWFQKFEYAIGHWLQKSTEHTIGCVLCSPGCFALFRAKALMDYNVMRKYATVPTEARHFIQYDQGEDRWLCTLLLQMGYKVEYSAASDAYTHAPETFNDFFIQRRRWIPSTVANIFDLLETAAQTKKNNRDISWLYIAYQWVLMGSTVLGPGTIFLMLVGAFVAAFRIENWPSFGYNLIPVIIFCVVCYFCKEQTQLLFARIIAAIYGLVMIVVLVGIMIQIVEDGWLAPPTLLLLVVASELILTGFLHPLEWTCLFYGVIYYVTVPSMYMLLIIFSLFNMNNITWGTRGAPKAVVAVPENEQQQQPTAKAGASQKKSFGIPGSKSDNGSVEFSLANLFKCILCTQEKPKDDDTQLKDIVTSLARIETRLHEMERNVENASRPEREAMHQGAGQQEALNAAGVAAPRPTVAGVTFAEPLPSPAGVLDDDGDERSSSDDDDYDSEDGASVGASSFADSVSNFLVAPNWMHGKDLGKGEVDYLTDKEEIFWKRFISTYLDPIDKDEKREQEIAEKVTDLRDQYLFKFFMINALFVLIVFLMQLNKEMLHFKWPLGVKYNISYVAENTDRYIVKIDKEYLRLEPIGCLFILGFLSILLVQFIAMLFHRFDTFAHIMAKVTIEWYCCDKGALSEEAIIEREAQNILKELQRNIDGAAKAETGHNSTIPPRKRKTIHQTINANNQRQSYSSFSSDIKRTLDAGEANEPSRKSLLSKPASLAIQRVLQKRRSVLQARQSQSANPGTSSIYAPANSSTSSQRRPTGIQQAYDNPVFEDDELSDQENARMRGPSSAV